MKYLSLETVAKAYVENTKNTSNKFWGLLAIISSLNHEVHPCVSYTFEVQQVSNLLEKLFALKKDKKTYSQATKWGVIFSNKWVDYVNTELLSHTPNIYDIIGWYFRNTPLEENINNENLIKLFLESSHLSVEVAKQIFDFKSKDLLFSDTLYSESQLASTLKATFNIPSTTNTTITFDKNFVVASPGELARAPFVQPLYAGQGVQECLILTQFSFEDMYTTIKQTPNPNNRPLQQIFYGAPGTGKSHEVKIKTGELDDAGNEYEKNNVFRTTFHPDTDYATFVGCYKPTMRPTSKEEKTLTGKDEEITYKFVPQAFTDAYIYAYNNPEEPTYLVIEEINRGNCAQIFGDLFQLLDRKADGTSEYTIKADKDLAKYLMDGKDKEGHDVLLNKEGIKDEKLCLPANLNILATMNTSDQSLFPMDSAFKRRWDWEYMPISYNEPKSSAFQINVGSGYKWVEFIKQVNKRIFRLTQSEDKELGNFFIKDSINAEQFKSKVMFYLWYEVLRDEVENSRYFFKYTTQDGNGKETDLKFTFKDLYGDNAETILEGFLKYIAKGEE